MAAGRYTPSAHCVSIRDNADPVTGNRNGIRFG